VPLRNRGGHRVIAAIALNAAVFFLAPCASAKLGPIPIPKLLPGLDLKLLWNGETLANLSGGKQTGVAYDSVLDLIGQADTDALGGWQGGRLHIDLTRQDSTQPSLRYVGDTQTLSNISVANSRNEVYEFWYRQAFLHSHANIRVGIFGADDYFDTNQLADRLLNSSYENLPTMSGNVSSSVYPKPGYGIMGSYQKGHWRSQVALFQGHPENRSGVFNDGHMLLGELQYRSRPQNAHTIVKLGLWQYHQPERLAGSNPQRNWGGYVILQQALFERPAGPVSLFVGYGISPRAGNPIPRASVLGLDIPGLFASRPKDRLDLGMARASLRKKPAETSFEATYVVHLASELSVQPDVQYITHPSGIYPNAWVVGTRIDVSLP
jgi:porin